MDDEIDVDVIEDDFDDGLSVVGSADAAHEKRSDRKITKVKKRDTSTSAKAVLRLVDIVITLDPSL